MTVSLTLAVSSKPVRAASPVCVATSSSSSCGSTPNTGCAKATHQPAQHPLDLPPALLLGFHFQE